MQMFVMHNIAFMIAFNVSLLVWHCSSVCVSLLLFQLGSHMCIAMLRLVKEFMLSAVQLRSIKQHNKKDKMYAAAERSRPEAILNTITHTECAKMAHKMCKRLSHKVLLIKV